MVHDCQPTQPPQFPEFPADPTTYIEFGANLPATHTDADVLSGFTTLADITEALSISYFEFSVSRDHLTFEFIPVVPAVGRSNEWIMEVSDSALVAETIGEFVLQFDSQPASGGLLREIWRIDTDGRTALDKDDPVLLQTGAGLIEFRFWEDGSEGGGITQLGDSFSPVYVYQDGVPLACSWLDDWIPDGGLLDFGLDTDPVRVRLDEAAIPEDAVGQQAGPQHVEGS